MAPRKVTQGFLITFDGPEGCGKSTQAKVLARALRRKGFRVVLTRDPGGSPIAEEIRGLLLDPRYHGLSPFAEVLLYETCRASLVQEVILPALQKGNVVICDRFSDATQVYQGMAGGVPILWIRKIDQKVCQGVTPHITFILDVDSRQGLRRLRRGRSFDRMEGKPLRFHEAVRRGYRKIAKASRRIRWIPSLPLETVKNLVFKETHRVLQRHFGAARRD